MTVSIYANSIKQTSLFFKHKFNVFAFNFIGTNLSVTIDQTTLDFDQSFLKNLKSPEYFSYKNYNKVSHDTLESALLDLEECKSDFITITGKCDFKLFDEINQKFVELYKINEG
jgi:hypothetical protein